MEICKYNTKDGYRLEALCVFDDCRWTGPLDAQQPLWAAFVALEGHLAQQHNEPRRTLGHKGRRRRIENVELPDRLEDLDAD